MSPFDEMERMMESFWGKDPWTNMFPIHWQRPAWAELKPPFEGRTPKVDVIDRDTEVVVKAELPGVKKENLDVTLTDDMLTLRASTREESDKEAGHYHRRELSSGEFVRSVSLPAAVDGSKAKASFKDGLLELTVPKLKAEKRHSVKIE